jgi:hypothetical protein
MSARVGALRIGDVFSDNQGDTWWGIEVIEPVGCGNLRLYLVDCSGFYRISVVYSALHEIKLPGSSSKIAKKGD